MSEYIHQDDAYEWLRDKEIVFAEQDFAKVQAERDYWRKIALFNIECQGYNDVQEHLDKCYDPAGNYHGGAQ